MPTAQDADDPRLIVRHATLAVEGDSVARFRARWNARLRRDPQDRAALLAAATIARLTYDYATAERLVQEIQRGDPPRADRYTAYARLGLAQGLELRRFTVAARAQLERARTDARNAGDRLAEAEAMLWLAVSRAPVDGLAVEEALLDTVARMLPDAERSLHAQRRWRLAIVDALRGRAAEARSNAQASITLARAAGDLRAEADGHRVLGQVLQYRGQWDSALVALRHADDVYRRARCGCTRAAALGWQAQVLAALGRFGEMRDIVHEAMAEAEATSNPGALASAYRGYAVLSDILGDHSTTLDYTRRAAAHSAEIGDSTGVRLARELLAGVLLSTGALAEARRLTLSTLESGRRADDASVQYRALRALAAIAAAEGNWPLAADHLRQAHALLPTLPGLNYRAWLLHDEGRFALAQGDLDSAEEKFRSYLALSGGESSDVLRYDARARLADVHVRRGDVVRAEQEMVSASDELDHWRARLTDAELRIFAFQVLSTSLAAATERIERDARIARIIAAIAHGGRVDAALQLAERRRARELRDRLLRAEALRTGCDAAGCVPASASLLTETRTARELAASLPDDSTALLEFVGGVNGAPTTVFVLRRGRVVAVQIPADTSLSARVARLTSLVESGADAGTIARSLGSALLDDALAQLGAGVRRLIIVPDGVLHQLPWDVLRMRDGVLAGERYAISIAPSAALFAELRRNAVARAPSRAAAVRLLAFGDPDLRPNGAAADIADLPRLRASATEARRVAQYARSSVLRLRGAASADYLLQSRLHEYRIIHFATHAVIDERAAARSGIVLTPGVRHSGLVTPGELATLQLNADLVVLSACRSARGLVVGGEGVQGLTAPLLQAGALSVIATLWRIDDRETVAFIGDVYDALARGLTVGGALHAAKVTALRRGVPARHWAAFTIIGDPVITIPLNRPRRPFSLR